MDSRRCTSCGQTKQADEFYTKRSHCKVCIRSARAEYRRTHDDEVRQSKAASRRKYIEKYRLKDADYYAANREQKKAWQQEYRQADPERNSRQKAEYYQRHREEVKKAAAEYRSANQDRVRATIRAYAHTPKGRAVIVQGRTKRRLAMLGRDAADCTQIIAQWRGQTVKCYLCGMSLPGRDCHIDHVMPLARGGKHEPGNLAPACPTCNMRKGSKTLEEYLSGHQTTTDSTTDTSALQPAQGSEAG
jgi:5-methylcytosine-specific restriction endonuclease McrA